MNKIFKVIWNPATGSYSVASETAKSRGKKSGRSKLLVSALVVGGLLSSFETSAGNQAGTGVDTLPSSIGNIWIAIGEGSQASTDAVQKSSIAIGPKANALASGATAIGYNSFAGNWALALGLATNASGDRSTAMGNSATASGQFSLALGGGTTSTGQASIVVGRESSAINDYATAVGYKSNANGLYSLAIGMETQATGNDSLALGRKALTSAANAIAMGAESEAAENATAIGNKAHAKGENSIAMGPGSLANNANSIALGNGSQSLADSTITIGQGSKTNGTDAIVLGNGSQSSGLSSIALGNASVVTGDNSIALGSNTSVNGINAVALGAGSIADLDDSVSVGNDSLKRKIVNVKNGTIKSDSHDAINGSQLYAISDSVAKRLGGGASVNVDDGTVKAPAYNLKNGNKNNVGDALTVLDENTLQWDQTRSKYSAAHGSSTTSVITDVANGTISDTSKDAINGSQLKTTNDNVTTNTTNITNLTDDVADINTAITGLEDDALQWNGTAFSAKHGTSTTNKITNVMAGDLSDTSTDAVNGAQLKTTNDNVATNTTNITNLTDDVADINTAITGLEDDALQWNGTAFSAKHGTNTTSKITNVMAGDLSDTSTDAVNGAQLKTTNDNVATNTTNITNLTDDVADINTTITGLEDDALQWNGTAFSAKHGTNTTSKITNVMAGDLSDTSTDAVNGSQLKTTNDNVATNTTNITNLTNDVADINTTITGLEDDALQWNGTAFSAKHGTSTTNKITNVAIGDINANSTDAINGSQLYSLSSSVATYLGGNAAVDASGALTGPTYNIDGTDYSNVGDALNAINTSMGNSLGDALLWDSQTGAFSASHSGSASQITNVAAGAVDATSSDAVNGSQLYTMSNSVADALGGGSTVNTDGSISAPSYTIANADYDNVGDALDAIDSTLDDALLWDATAGNNGAFNASHNGSASVITNVADGLVDANSNDAVNGSQLYATNMMINNFAGDTSNTYTEKNGTGINYIRTNDTGLTFHDASATGIGSTAVGYNSVASGASSIAIGQDSSSTIDTGIAIGSNSVSDRVIVKSSRSTSVTKNGVVIGYDTTDGELLGALSIGDDGKYRQIINIADGSEAHDAVTVRQLQNAIGAVATTPTKYFHANSTAEDSLAVGTDSLAIGAKTAVNADAGIGIGLNTLVLTDAINGIAIGSNARVNHADSIAIGNGSQTTRGAQSNYTAYNMNAPQNSVGEFSVGSGQGQRQITNVAAGSADTDAVNVGQLKVTDARVEQNTQSITNLNTQVTNLDTRVTNIENGIGDIVTTGSTKYFKANTTGADANAQGTDSVAIGSGSIAAADNSVALGTGSVADEENTISVGSSTNQRRITNVAAGKNATDAVNVAQLKSSEAGSVRYDTKSDGSVDYSSITLGGGNGGTTRISNVSAGVENNDAVNYAQLKQSVQETKQYTDQRMVEMDHKLSKTESKLSGGIASAMAMTGLPQAYTPGASMASIGGGTYNGESAVALGVSMVSANGRWVYKLQGSTNSQGEYSAALGAGIQW
ncbi:YadA-like family protein [Escherichia marmotae]|uniref:YadA-like family protein n=1 Tax=Escherichia marmotae TaxID=1499973 RepID=UPI000E1D5B6A|nr:YadA-like family protein [Escherichia marmotae]RDR62058.1 Adhesin YadA precursor [Escherichia marmotae]